MLRGLRLLVDTQKLGDPVEIQVTVEITDEGAGNGVDARVAGEIGRGQFGKPAVVSFGQILLHLPQGSLDDVEVIKEPLGGAGEGFFLLGALDEAPVRLAKLFLPAFQRIQRRRITTGPGRGSVTFRQLLRQIT